MSATSRERGAIPANPNQSRRSAEVADILLTQNSAMTIIDDNG